MMNMQTEQAENVKTPQTLKPGYKQTEVGVIPEDWNLEPLGSHFDFKNGLNKEKHFFGKGTPIVNYMDVFEHSMIVPEILNGRVELSLDERKRYNVKYGDVFFTRTSETRDEIGVSAVCTKEFQDTVFSGFVLRARPISSFFDVQFCRFCFSSRIARRQIERTASITTRALTNGRLLSEVKIPLPPTLAEQTAISAALS
ncbi:MAG: restriction endonuclease subunit S, partial [Balneolales bacterium]|nr:restriction endonuclease subunit S [Balneolales bacterium]